MLWPEKRQGPMTSANSVIPGPSYIQRTTAVSYISRAVRLSAGRACCGGREWLQNLLERLAAVGIQSVGDLQIGPIPKGFPVNALANIQLLAESPRAEDKIAHAKKLIPVVKKLKAVLKSIPRNATEQQIDAAWRNVEQDLLTVSKCPDFIVNKGHYFGTNLSDDDKNALIEFLKTF